ncbi:hypothetical protein BU25DRAFT_44818 [Macroventuria anomochaeta]|uniref:Uncharacterized protein n=1 Tax=Macroventuria anomochaeta TaxID=301207 RepID=A0ACB6S2R8_9PLEO|nr:uncharacterized protein BU25DRAFT_44818 [Macroventuria anomochaeta]KAF2627822.1 hypothetical protein BU25DRAFT_44818 [Macroventuria anomochaeta]
MSSLLSCAQDFGNRQRVHIILLVSYSLICYISDHLLPEEKSLSLCGQHAVCPPRHKILCYRSGCLSPSQKY